MTEEGYRDITTSTGEEIRVYTVPQQLIWSAVPGEKPPVPMHETQTAAGTQQRLAKEGDPEWEPYLRAIADWEEKQEALQENLLVVLALRDYQWPESPIAPPEYLRVAVDCGAMPWPDDSDVIAQRAAYARATFLPSARDTAEISHTVSILGGIPEEYIEASRDRFQREVRETYLGGDTEGSDSEGEPAVEGSEGSP